MEIVLTPETRANLKAELPPTPNAAVIKFLPSGKIHLVEANDGVGQGSLYGFHTYCGRTIREMKEWEELDPYSIQPTCGNCIAMRPHVNRLRRLDHIKLVKMCAEMRSSRERREAAGR